MSKKQKYIKLQKSRRTRGVIIAIVLFIILLPYAVCWWERHPAGFSVRSKPCSVPTDSVRLLIDSTSFDAGKGERIFDQQIFDAVLKMIRDAKQTVYVDFFLWNYWTGSIPESHRGLAQELSESLIAKKKESPETHILVMTDPVNRVYGGDEQPFYEAMRQAGICIVFTALDKMPESNFFYAAPARFYGPLISRIPGIRQLLNIRLLKHPFEEGGQNISLLQFGRLLFFKANHRKVVITDGPGGWQLLVTSFNPANGSSGHSNIGLQAGGEIAREALATELQCVKWSAENPGNVLEPEPGACALIIGVLSERLSEPPLSSKADEKMTAEWLTEECIARKAEALLDACGTGDEVRLAMFYLADRKLITAIREAADGGADVRIILDANRDAFGRVKNGVPNRPVAAELMEHAVREGVRLQIRWADTHGEQFHPKVLSISNAEGKADLLCGSANWTRRNLRDLNLEANLHLKNAPEVSRAFGEWFDLCWDNADGRSRTVPYEVFAVSGFERSRKALMGRFQEATGMSTF